MRSSRLLFAAAVAAVLATPSFASAQTQADDFCAVTSTPVSCSKTKVVTTSINSLLYLGIIANAPIALQANDTAAYEKTYRANGNAAGTTGAAVTTAATLQSAAASDSVVVRANRPYKLSIEATTDIFDFDKDLGYNVCRKSATATTGCTATETLDGKPVSDLYWSTDNLTFAPIKGATAATASPDLLKDSTTGGRYGTAIFFKSAWYYATDIPGSYTATVRYTVTGQ
jgi:hypothetical protein